MAKIEIGLQYFWLFRVGRTTVKLCIIHLVGKGKPRYHFHMGLVAVL